VWNFHSKTFLAVTVGAVRLRFAGFSGGQGQNKLDETL